MSLMHFTSNEYAYQTEPKLNCRRKMKNIWRKRNAHIETMVLLSHTNTHTRTENDLITQNGTDKEWKRTMSSEVLIIITSMVELISKEIAGYGWLRICQCVLYWCERIASIVLDIEKTNIRLGASPMSRFMQKPVEIICTVLYSHLHSMMKPYIANRLWFKEWRNRRSDSMIHLLICDFEMKQNL